MNRMRHIGCAWIDNRDIDADVLGDARRIHVDVNDLGVRGKGGHLARNAVIKAGARIGPNSVIGANCHVAEDAQIDGAILWPHTWVDRHARLGALIAGRHCQFGRHVEVSGEAMLGDNSVVTDFSRL